MLEFIGLLAPLFAALILRTDRRIVRTLRDEQALSPDRAFPFDPQNAFVRWRFRRLAFGGAIRPAAQGRWYLDEAGLDNYRWARRKRLIAAAGVAIAVMATVMFMQRR